MLLGEAVAVRDEDGAAGQLELHLAGEKLNAEVFGEEGAAPAVVVSPDEGDGDAARANLLQPGDGRKMFAGDYAAILEPEVEQIAGEHQVIPRLRDLFQKCMERPADRRRHLAEVRIGNDDDSHGPSLGSWNHARKHITVEP